MKKLLLITLLFTSLLTFAQEAYYNDVNLNLSGTALKNALATKIIASHTNMLSYTPGVWEASKITDKDTDATKVVLIYGWENGSDGDDTNDRIRNSVLQDRGTGENFVWNREHVFSKSLANPTLQTNNPGPGTDAHNLRPADKNRNSARNNFKFALGSGTASQRSNVTYSGPDGPNTRGWYPGDEWKGDVARIIMYMYLRYGEQCLPTAVGVGDKQFTPDDMIDLFLIWNKEDPVSDFEKDRNTYHENTSNTYAQGNRNPFIDNPYLATRIWGGVTAQDTWGIYVNSDTQAPTTPTNVVASNQTTTSVDLSWTLSSDNVGVTGYDIFVNDVLTSQTTNATTVSISGLTPNTTYAFTVQAKDLINNKSTKSTVLNAATLQDTQAPTIPTNIVASNISGTTFKIDWNASTDNTGVTGYEVFLNGNFTASVTELTYSFTGLTVSTAYSVTVLAKDATDNKSAQSAGVNVTTSDGASNGITELFISEYTEPAGGHNKAIEIVNLSGAPISLDGYSLKKQSNGASWVDELPLNKTEFLVDPSTTSILPNDVFVIIHSASSDATLVANSDLKVPENQSPPYQHASPLNFNGNDPVGLFKNGVLIDIVGEEGNTSKHIEDVTLRRKNTITTPNATYDAAEWDFFPANTFTDFGTYTLPTVGNQSYIFESFKMFPNPANGNRIYFSVTENATINIHNVLGKLIKKTTVSKNKNSIDISDLSKGIYLIKIISGKQFITKKLIKN